MEFLWKLYLAAILLEVQLLFEKEAWALEDFLSLPSVYDDMHSGIYGNFAISGVDAHNMGMDPDVYVRSSKCLREQVYKHHCYSRKSFVVLGGYLGS